MEPEPNPDYKIKIEQIRSNLKNWRSFEWVIFWGFIPALLLVVYALPQTIKDDYFILNTAHPWRLQTYFLSSYTHSQLYPHLVGNLAFYFVVLLMIFAFENNRRRFWLVAPWSFCLVPFVSSFLTIFFWSLLGRATTGQGFSAIIGALLAYAMFVFVVWSIKDRQEVLDNPELFTGSAARYNALRILLAVALALIVVMGVQSGIFTDAGGSVSNGIAHFGGFTSTLVVLLIFDIQTEKRRFFDNVLGTAILIGILWYGYYLFLVVRLVRNG